MVGQIPLLVRNRCVRASRLCDRLLFGRLGFLQTDSVKAECVRFAKTVRDVVYQSTFENSRILTTPFTPRTIKADPGNARSSIDHQSAAAIYEPSSLETARAKGTMICMSTGITIDRHLLAATADGVLTCPELSDPWMCYAFLSLTFRCEYCSREIGPLSDEEMGSNKYCAALVNVAKQEGWRVLRLIDKSTLLYRSLSRPH
jgi:hypothetical protein